MPNLKDNLLQRATVGTLWHQETKGKSKGVRCYACGHRCFIPEGHDGICKVRSNIKGQLYVPWGYVGGLQVDPIEKKPFFHVLPGTNALSFGMLGCDFHCAYCQNWFTSQALRDPNAQGIPEAITAEEICTIAKKHGAPVLTSTYNEPLITSEWAVEIFKKAHGQGLFTSYVSNGNATPEVLEYIRPFVDFYKVDLKSFNDRHYRQLGGVLSNITDSIARIYQMKFHLEIVTLIIPGFNDDPKELTELTQFLANISPNIPWHATAFHQDYKMTKADNTSVKSLLNAAEIGSKAGLKLIYLGNLPGQVGKWENTYCPHCHHELITRHGFKVIHNEMTSDQCPKCHQSVPGVWTRDQALNFFGRKIA